MKELFHRKGIDMETKTYYILPRDQYGQPNGCINTVELTEVEAQEYRDHGVYLMDNYLSALYRAQD